MKEFVTAIKDAHDEDQDSGTECKVDGQVLRYFKPSPGQYAMFVATTGRHSGQSDRIAGVIDLFMDAFDEPSQVYLAKRLHDRDDPFDMASIEEMMEAMIEEWTGRPTQRPRDSTKSRTSAGRKSTGTTRTSTSSGSPLTVS